MGQTGDKERYIEIKNNTMTLKKESCTTTHASRIIWEVRSKQGESPRLWGREKVGGFFGEAAYLVGNCDRHFEYDLRRRLFPHYSRQVTIPSWVSKLPFFGAWPMWCMWLTLGAPPDGTPGDGDGAAAPVASADAGFSTLDACACSCARSTAWNENKFSWVWENVGVGKIGNVDFEGKNLGKEIPGGKKTIIGFDELVPFLDQTNFVLVLQKQWVVKLESKKTWKTTKQPYAGGN